MRTIPTFFATIVIAFCAVSHAAEEEAVMEEIVVEATFDVRLELLKQSQVQIIIDRLTLKAATERALDLQIANRTPLSTLLELTRYSPISLGGSENRVDTFFLENYMRPDLNPREKDPLSLGR